MAFCVLIIAQAVGASSAHATSYYDNILKSADYLLVKSVEGTTDLSLDWVEPFTGVLEDRNSPTDQEMLAQFNDNLNTGSGWLVQSIYSGMRVITFDPGATVGFEGNAYGANHLTFSQGDVCVWEAVGHNWVNWNDISVNPLKYYVTVVCGTYSEVVGMSPYYLDYNREDAAYLFIASDHLQYPVGYAGDLIPTEYTTPVPVPFAGTVDCFGEDPQSMMIYQYTNNGAATLTYESLGRATWEYSLLPNTPYAIVVDCDGTLANSYGAVVPSSTSGDWVCDPYAVQYDQPYCVLS